MNTDTITHIDCLKSLPHIQDQSIDIVLTDPPNGKGLSAEEAIDGLIGLYHAAKKAKRYVVFFASPFYVPTAPPDWYEVARHVWHKPDARSRASYELIIVWAREYKLQRCRVLTIPLLNMQSLRDWKPHPTQKPLRLIRYLLTLYSEVGETVLDPFVGSGTTALACQQLRRHFVCFEKNPLYAAMATRRLDEPTIASNQQDDRNSPDARLEQKTLDGCELHDANRGCNDRHQCIRRTCNIVIASNI